MNRSRVGLLAVTLAAFALIQGASPASAALTDQEFKCSAAVAKSYSKLQTQLLKLYDRCHKDDISGKLPSGDACDTLDPKSEAKAEKAKSKLIQSVAKACHSVCTISNDVECVSDLTCPAFHVASPANNSVAETCGGKAGGNPFRLRSLDWPGPYCDSILGHEMTSSSDLGECLAELVDLTVEPIDTALYADLDGGSGISKETLKCATSISKAVQRAAGRAYTATAPCRDARRSANVSTDPAWACAAEDPDAIEKIDKELTKMSSSIAKKCVDADIAALTGLCAAGGTTPTTVADAQACFTEMVRDVATEERGLGRHTWAPIGMLNATHPQSAYPYCGDGVVTAKREEHTGVGEECDGDDDAACGAGSCLPPGDVFECTCDNVVRERFVVAGGSGTDSDAGWKGASHDATHNNGFGYVTELSNCDCDEFTQATCTGSTLDSDCDVYGNRAPRCSDDINGVTCDARGNGDGGPSDSDCFVCDSNSINAGQWCANGTAANETVCQSQCIDDETGLPVAPQTPCINQEGCGDGETCRGRCDNTLTCNRMTEGSPLPQISAAISVCILLEYKTDVTGVKNIVTGESTVNYETRTIIQLGNLFTVPCPVCSGVCLGGTNDGKSCFGRCNVSNDECLVDGDCVGVGDTACLETADDCAGGSCTLDLRCSGGANAGGLCRPDSATPLGVVSHDCPPEASANISGLGVRQPFGDVTTEPVQFPAGGACTDASWHNYECACPADSGPIIGVPTQPSGCAAACNGGVNEGVGCATGTGGLGTYTVCVGGSDAGFVCDEDSDCEGGGACSGNPKHCTAGTPALLGSACTVNANCGGGGLCEDACPGARCVPLCYPQGACNGGSRDGDNCATLHDCRECTAGNPLRTGDPCTKNSSCDTTLGSGDGVCSPVGGVTCDISDDEEGLCAAGPVKLRCTGAGYTTLPCTLDTGTCTGSVCTKGAQSLLGSACSVAADCIVNNVPVQKGCEAGNDGILGNSDDNPGAGDCEPRPEDCYYNNGYAEGGDTLNGDGSPSDVKLNAAFCTPPNGFSAIDNVSGFGGPSRVRRSGSAFVNVPATP